MSGLFPSPPDSQGSHVLRIYYPRPFKQAYVLIRNGIVTHCSENIPFTLGWTKEKVVAQAEKVGFTVVRINTMQPRSDWLTVRPAPLQPVVPAPCVPEGVRPYIDPKAVRQAVEAKWDDMGVSPQKPKRDAKGRFIKKGLK